MGTRNLTIVKHKGEYKVAQYGQWDGYPSGQGLTVLEFARSLCTVNTLLEFTRKVDAVQVASIEYINDINKRIDNDDLKDWTSEYPELSWDTCAKILQMIMDRPPGIKLKDDINFAADSLFCEWAYVIDLDDGTFEAYQGFNRSPLKSEDRFFFLSGSRPQGYGEDFYPIKLYPGAKWNLQALPTQEEFVSTFYRDRGEDIA